VGQGEEGEVKPLCRIEIDMFKGEEVKSLRSEVFNRGKRRSRAFADRQITKQVRPLLKDGWHILNCRLKPIKSTK
jgi:hypothetical protein